MDKPATFSAEHFGSLASTFDAVLPYTEPVAHAILARLPDLESGQLVLDLACGTGEPGLTLAKARPEVQVVGTDIAAQMIAVANGKAKFGNFDNIRFEVAADEELPFDANSVDAAISRFGFLQYDYPAASAASLARVLKSDGSFSIAVWGPVVENTFVQISLRALGAMLSSEQLPNFERFENLDRHGQRESSLAKAGFQQVESEYYDWCFELPSADVAWYLMAGPVLFGTQIASLEPSCREQLRERFIEMLAQYRVPSGGYELPHRCRIIYGKR